MSLTLWTVLAVGAPPRMVDLGTLELDTPFVLRRRSFFVAEPPQIPALDPLALPEPVIVQAESWRDAWASLRRVRAKDAEGASENERTALWRRAQESEELLRVALEALAVESMNGAGWLLLGTLRSTVALKRYLDSAAVFRCDSKYDDDEWVEPVPDIASAIEAWSHIGQDETELRPWAQAYSAHLLERAKRPNEAAAAYREVLASASASPELRHWAAAELRELLLGLDTDAAQAALLLSAATRDGAVAPPSRLRLLRLAYSKGRFEDAALIGLARDGGDADAGHLASDVRKLTLQSLVRLGPAAPSVVAKRLAQGAVLNDVGSLLLEAAEQHADGGRMGWASVVVRAPEVMALRANVGQRQRIEALEERLSSAPSDDLQWWGRRVTTWCATQQPFGVDAFAASLTVRASTKGREPVVRLIRRKGDFGAVGRCLKGLIPPPEGPISGGFRADLHYMQWVMRPVYRR